MKAKISENMDKKTASGKPRITQAVLKRFITANEEKLKAYTNLINGTERIPKSHLSITDRFALEMAYEEVAYTQKRLAIAEKYLQYLKDKREVK